MTTTIRPAGRLPTLRVHELVEYRDLYWLLVWRDVRLRYKQTAIGAAWAVLQPLVLMVVFSVFLGHFAHVSSEGFPYPVFTYGALVPWTLFSQAASQAADSLVSSASVITKVYFPRIVVPLAAASSPLLDAAISLVLLVGLMVFYGIRPRIELVAFPGVVLLALLLALAVGIWLSALNVRYRDVRYALPLLFQVWLFATPVAYSLSAVPERWRWLVACNPMVSVVELSRWSLLGTGPGGALALGISAGVTVVLLLGGLAYFQSTERGFADLV
ncbi:MAG TPA: ABC transporter permease [Acidimicrobiales bacterium]|nr:ABC transporter permease [Acidimicrobiales bacterium]